MDKYNKEYEELKDIDHKNRKEFRKINDLLDFIGDDKKSNTKIKTYFSEVVKKYKN